VNSRSGEYELDEKKNEFMLNCCDWQAITEIADDVPILVTVFFRVYRLLDIKIRFKDLYDATQKNMYKETKFEAQFIGASVACHMCYGKRRLDWIEKIMRKRSFPDENKRDPYARVLKFKVPIKYNPHLSDKNVYINPFFTDTFLDDLKKKVTHQYIYTSYPTIDTHEEYCPKCYGSGLREITNNQIVLVETLEGANFYDTC
jgi:hypothetical protein